MISESLRNASTATPRVAELIHQGGLDLSLTCTSDTAARTGVRVCVDRRSERCDDAIVELCCLDDRDLIDGDASPLFIAAQVACGLQDAHSERAARAMVSNGRRRSKARRDLHKQAPDITAEHILQLFDTDESLAACVAAFLRDGARANQSLLVVATMRHWTDIAAALADRGVDVAGLRHDHRLTVLDAEETLGLFMRKGEPNGALFAQSVGPLVARLASDAPCGLRVYGEMVEVLAQEANYRAAAQLEMLWNDLGRRIPFCLLCGYAAAHFAAPDAGSALSAICALHSRSECLAGDPLGRFLLEDERTRRSLSLPPQ